jgi:hypothetical protein
MEFNSRRQFLDCRNGNAKVLDMIGVDWWKSKFWPAGRELWSLAFEEVDELLVHSVASFSNDSIDD